MPVTFHPFFIKKVTALPRWRSLHTARNHPGQAQHGAVCKCKHGSFATIGTDNEIMREILGFPTVSPGSKQGCSGASSTPPASTSLCKPSRKHSMRLAGVRLPPRSRSPLGDSSAGRACKQKCEHRCQRGASEMRTIKDTGFMPFHLEASRDGGRIPDAA